MLFGNVPSVSDVSSSGGGAGRSSAISLTWPMLLVVGRGATKGTRNERTAENLHFFAVPAAAPLLLFSSSFILSFRYVSRKPFHFFRHTSSENIGIFCEMKSHEYLYIPERRNRRQAGFPSIFFGGVKCGCSLLPFHG
ncbi:hypothetical protein ATANTOWER_030132 [Ataeniobius toweri]|uniref:Uncharacterized protein n=1 Tax=Ataeniobius toweri TaxID=208326 RepID=A0ABU7A8I9_9TELE|nr:hypothetical protein [Ataeniobius toweri]